MGNTNARSVALMHLRIQVRIRLDVVRCQGAEEEAPVGLVAQVAIHGGCPLHVGGERGSVRRMTAPHATPPHTLNWFVGPKKRSSGDAPTGSYGEPSAGTSG